MHGVDVGSIGGSRYRAGRDSDCKVVMAFIVMTIRVAPREFKASRPFLGTRGLFYFSGGDGRGE